MSVESQRKAFHSFLRAVKAVFGPRYLNREPILTELQAIESKYSAKGFPGCVGSVDCMQFYWKNCPKALKGQYHNPKNGRPASINCEAMTDSDLYCWHWFAGRAGTNIDITLVDNSPLFIDILTGRRRMYLADGYEVDEKVRHWKFYYLVNGIYPYWAIFVRLNHAPANEQESLMTVAQEATRTDVERLFGNLQGRFHILRRERHEWSDEVIILISQVCVILHNMLVSLRTKGELDDETDDDGSLLSSSELLDEFYTVPSDPPVRSRSDSGVLGDHYAGTSRLGRLLDIDDQVCSLVAHNNLRSALARHISALYGFESRN
jgi:hypothetical protein